jgi:23S rRNA pseudoU1915 N3-methylase RlmH
MATKEKVNFRFHRGFSSETDSDVKCKQTSIGQVSEMELIIGGSQGASQRYKTTDLQKPKLAVVTYNHSSQKSEN